MTQTVEKDLIILGGYRRPYREVSGQYLRPQVVEQVADKMGVLPMILPLIPWTELTACRGRESVTVI